MEHDQRTCPRCGEPAGDYRFCQTCRSHIDSLNGISTHAGSRAADPSHLAAQVLRLEQALAAASEGIGNRVGASASGAAVQVDPDPGTGGGVTDAGQPPRDVARMEDVLTDAGTRPVIERPVTADERLSNLMRPPREVARLEDVLTVASPDETERIPARTAAGSAPTVSPAQDEAETVPEAKTTPVEATEPAPIVHESRSDPIYVAAHALRAAFWFEQTSAFESRADEEPIALPAPEASVPPPAPRPHPAPVITSVAPPSLSEADAQPSVRDESPEPVVHRDWLTALCLLALIALVVVLTGRHPRRSAGAKTS